MRRLIAAAFVAGGLALTALLVLAGPGLALLEVGEALPPSYGDAILVLGGGMRDGGQLGFSTAERLALAAHLYAERQRDIVVSDGCMFAGVHGSIAMRSELIRMGVLTEHRTSRTLGAGTNYTSGPTLCWRVNAGHEEMAGVME